MRLTELAADLQALRADLAEELLAINRYEAQTISLADEEARDVVARVLDDKKEHVAVLLGQLRRLDVKQREKLDRLALAGPEQRSAGERVAGPSRVRATSGCSSVG